MFSVLARRDIGGRVPTILEGEAGANDPVAIALVVGLVDYATTGAVRRRAARRLPGRDGRRRGRWHRRRDAARAGDAATPLPREGALPVRTLAIAGLIYGGADPPARLRVPGRLRRRRLDRRRADAVQGRDRALPRRARVARRDRRLRRPRPHDPPVRHRLVDARLRLALAAGSSWSCGRWRSVRCSRPSGCAGARRAFIALTGFKGAVPILLAALVVLEGVPTPS